jgi:protein-tyrosine phosphatase
VTAPDPSTLVDIHSHLVPGVDDGARHLEAALESVERMTATGIRRLVTTPHIQASLTLDPASLESRLAEVDEAFDTAANAVSDRFPEVDFLRGHEVIIDVTEPELAEPRIRMNGTSFVLVEWPRLQVPPGTARVLRWIRDQGYRPIIAHPERYTGVSDNPGILGRWKEAGAYLQVNYGSVVGRYGAAAQAAAFVVLERGLADYLASDFHGHSGLKIYKEEAWAVLEERGAGEALEVLCRANPARLLDDLEPLPVTPVPGSSRLLDRLRRMVKG